MCWSIFHEKGLMDCLCLQQTNVWLRPEFCLLGFPISLISQAPIQPCLHIPRLLCSKTWLKLKSQLWYEVPHSAPQRTFLADYKELFFCITFPPLWPNLAPCSAFSQHRICHIWSQWNSGEIIDVLHYSAAIRYGISFLKIPNFNLVKKLADWTISAVPSNSKLPQYLYSSAWLLPV